MMLRDPPLVEMPIATSSGRACAMIWRRKIGFDADIVGDRGEICGLHGQARWREPGDIPTVEARNRWPNRWRRWPIRHCRK